MNAKVVRLVAIGFHPDHSATLRLRGCAGGGAGFTAFVSLFVATKLALLSATLIFGGVLLMRWVFHITAATEIPPW